MNAWIPAPTQVHTHILHMSTLMHIHWLKNGLSEAQCLKLTVMQRGGTSWEWACKHITDWFVSLQCKCLVETSECCQVNSLPFINQRCNVCLHECWHDMWRSAGLFGPFMDYKASVSHQWHFLVFWEVQCTPRSEWLKRKWSFLREVYSGKVTP